MIKVRKYKNRWKETEYSITHLSELDFQFLASVLANLKRDVPVEATVGRFKVEYDQFTTIVPPYCGHKQYDFVREFSKYGRVVVLARPIIDPDLKFDIDDV